MLTCADEKAGLLAFIRGDVVLCAGSRLYCDLDGWHVFLKDIKGIEKLKLNQVCCRCARPHLLCVLHRTCTILRPLLSWMTFGTTAKLLCELRTSGSRRHTFSTCRVVPCCALQARKRHQGMAQCIRSCFGTLSQVLAEAIGTKMPSSGLDGRSFLEELLKITPIRCHAPPCGAMHNAFGAAAGWGRCACLHKFRALGLHTRCAAMKMCLLWRRDTAYACSGEACRGHGAHQFERRILDSRPRCAKIMNDKTVMSGRSLGGGKTQVSLLDMVPAACVDEMGELLDSYDFQR